MEELKFENSIILHKIIPAAIYLLGVNSGKTKCEIVKCEVFSMKTQEYVLVMKCSQPAFTGVTLLTSFLCLC